LWGVLRMEKSDKLKDGGIWCFVVAFLLYFFNFGRFSLSENVLALVILSVIAGCSLFFAQYLFREEKK
jgi:hypothetical protein